MRRFNPDSRTFCHRLKSMAGQEQSFVRFHGHELATAACRDSQCFSSLVTCYAEANRRIRPEADKHKAKHASKVNAGATLGTTARTFDRK